MGWKVGTWSGLPNYECTSCPFKTYDEERIEDHVYRHHGVFPADVRREQEEAEAQARREQEAATLAEENSADELKALAEAAGVETSGTKAEIAARIVGAEDKEMNDGN
jgi:hypothetical protein